MFRGTPPPKTSPCEAGAAAGTGKQNVSEPLGRIYTPVLGRVSGICVETVVFKICDIPENTLVCLCVAASPIFWNSSFATLAPFLGRFFRDFLQNRGFQNLRHPEKTLMLPVFGRFPRFFLNLCFDFCSISGSICRVLSRGLSV